MKRRNSLLARRGAIAVAAVAALALALGLPAAEATRTVKIPSQISIHENALRFKGKVTSTKTPCVANRKVTLFRRFGKGDNQALGSTTTNGKGHWHMRVSGSAGISMGRFFAKARRRSEGTAGTIFVCQRARSKTVAFH